MRITNDSPGGGGGKREISVVEVGWHTGEVRFADELEKWNKIRITLDLSDGRRCRFSIASGFGKDVAQALGVSTPGDELNPDDLLGKQMVVRLGHYVNDEGTKYNTFKEIKKAAGGDSTGAATTIKSEEIPF